MTWAVVSFDSNVLMLLNPSYRRVAAWRRCHIDQAADPRSILAVSQPTGCSFSTLVVSFGSSACSFLDHAFTNFLTDILAQ